MLVGEIAFASISPSLLADSQWCCAEHSCAAYAFGAGVIGGDTDGCTNGISLTTSSDPSCTVKCGAGYTGDATTVTCASDAFDGAATTSSISCTGDGNVHEIM